jgi:hypothetical protein
MTVHELRGAHSGKWSPRSRLAVVAVCMGIAAAGGHGVAWAETGHSASSETSSTDSGAGPKKPADGNGPDQKASSDADSTTTKSSAPQAHSPKPHQDTSGTASADAASPGTDPTTASPSATEPTSTAPEQDSSTTTPRATSRASQPTGTSHPGNAESAQADSSADAAKNVSASVASQEQSKSSRTRSGGSPPQQTSATPAAFAAETAATTSAPAVKVAAVTTATAASTTTPTPPEPLSPIAQVIALPGRIINTLLQALDLTVAVGGPKSPLDFSPIDELLFAAFRRVEGVLGLDRTPAAQQVLQTETYTGPTTGSTPTVTQFLNAAAAEYVLGGTPGGLQAFTVDGVPMTLTNVFSGASAQAWVTPQKQIIIAYQGTTGGTNLLFNPLIAISQILTDAQVILTDSTPQAFTDSLAFEQQVQAAAALQGYATGDIFLTGHSLGGWEAEYVAQQTGLGGIGFESPGINTVVPGNGVNSGFVNIETYGDTAAYLATDLPGLQPFIPAYVPGGGSKPHYGSIVMIGDPNATTPLINAASLWGPNLIGDAIFVVDLLGNFFEHHLPGMQAYNLGISPDPGVVPWLGAAMGPIVAEYRDLTIPQLQQAASANGMLITP